MLPEDLWQDSKRRHESTVQPWLPAGSQVKIPVSQIRPDQFQPRSNTTKYQRLSATAPPATRKDRPPLTPSSWHSQHIRGDHPEKISPSHAAILVRLGEGNVSSASQSFVS